MKTMKISLDDGQTWQNWQETNGVRVLYENLDIPGEDITGDIEFNFTHEGIITDIWASPSDHNLATRSETIDEIVEALIKENS